MPAVDSGMDDGAILQTTGIESILATCRALGACGVGGALSPDEMALLDSAPNLASGIDIGSTRDGIVAGEDPLGEMLQSLRSQEQKRAIGAFYTPAPIVEAMVSWVLENGAQRVVDPGCGSGRFLMATHRHAPHLPLIGVDTDPLATLICRANLAALGVDSATVLHADYRHAELPEFGGCTGFLANPPYVRHHDLPSAEKAWAKAVGKQFGLTVSGLSGLHVHFFLATLLHARPGDVGSFITSAEWLDTQYGQAIRDALVGPLGGLILARAHPHDPMFRDALTTSCVACFRPGEPVRHIRFASAQRGQWPHLNGEGTARTAAELRQATTWGHLFGRSRRRPPEGLVELGELFRVSRGVATGANGFFVLSEPQAEAEGVLSWTEPVVSHAREIRAACGVLIPAHLSRRILRPQRDLEPDRAANRCLARYLDRGVLAGVPERTLCRQRTPWWHVTGQPSPLLVTYMARGRPSFALNPGRVLALNVAHGLLPKCDLTDEELAAFVAYLNGSPASLLGGHRVYGGGLAKWEPCDMSRILVPRPEAVIESVEHLGTA